MVKGISRQVIVVHSPDPKLFEQAIFILKDGATGRDGVTDEQLLREATRLINDHKAVKHRRFSAYGAVWACIGALLTGSVWFLSVLL